METVLFFGMSHLGARAAGLLVARGVRVVAAVPAGVPPPAGLAAAGVELVEAVLSDDGALAALPIASARALVLASDDEHLNLRAALLAVELNPAIRVVLRIFDLSLARKLEGSIPNLRALSASQLAAPAFAAAALLDEPIHVHRRGGGIEVVHRVPAGACAGRSVAQLEAEGHAPLSVGHDLFPVAGRVPKGEEPVVLFSTLAAAARLSSGIRAGGTLREPRRRGGAWRALATDRVLRGTLLALGVTLVAGVAEFGFALKLSPLDALYFVVTTLTTTGYGDVALLGAPAHAKVAGMAAMLAGVALSAVLVAIATDALLKKREDLLLGRRRSGARDHVVVCGAGDVGLRILQELERVGVRVVAVEKDAGHRHLEELRSLGVELVVSDAEREETLRNAGIGSARALVCATDDDLRNLRVALAARVLVPGLQVALRIFERPFARRIEHHFGIRSALSSSELAAPAFAAAALDEDVGGAIHARLEVAGVPLLLSEGPPPETARGEVKLLDRSGRGLWVRRG